MATPESACSTKKTTKARSAPKTRRALTPVWQISGLAGFGPLIDDLDGLIRGFHELEQ